MPKGTRRNSILNRRAGQKARMAYWLKRGLAGLLAVSVIGGSVSYAHKSGYVQQIESRMVRSFHEKMAASGLRVNKIMVDGRINTDREALKYLVSVDKGESIFLPDIQKLQAQIGELTWVKHARVERHLPDTIAIHIEENTPIALWQHRGKLSVIDADGDIISDSNLDRFRNLMILVGEDAPVHAKDLIGMISSERELKSRVESAKWIGNRRWDIYLKNGVTVKLPEDDIGEAMRRLAKAQSEAGLMDRQIEEIDLRYAGRIVVKTEPGASEEYQAAYHPQRNI